MRKGDSCFAWGEGAAVGVRPAVLDQKLRNLKFNLNISAEASPKPLYKCYYFRKGDRKILWVWLRYQAP